MKKCIADEEEWTKSKGRLFRTVFQLCTPALQNKLEGDTKYENLETNHDVNGLLESIKEVVYSTSESLEPFVKMTNCLHTLLTLRQHNAESLNGHCKRFMSQVEVTETECGKMIPPKFKGKPNGEQEKARLQFLSRMFLKGLNKLTFLSC